MEIALARTTLQVSLHAEPQSLVVYASCGFSFFLLWILHQKTDGKGRKLRLVILLMHLRKKMHERISMSVIDTDNRDQNDLFSRQ
jgi:hypothetical protein